MSSTTSTNTCPTAPPRDTALLMTAVTNTGARTHLTGNELLKRFRAVDCVVIDVDGCLVPGYTQAMLAHGVWHSLPPLSRARLQMMGMGGILYILKYLPLSSRCRHDWVHRVYAQTLRAIPESLLHQKSPEIWERRYPSAAECLSSLNQYLPVGVISLGLNVVIESLEMDMIKRHPGFTFAFRAANPLSTHPTAPRMIAAADKRRAFEATAEPLGLRVPLVIGHDKGEAELCTLTHRRGGLSVGFGISRQRATPFDLVFPRGDWTGLHRLISYLYSAELLHGGVVARSGQK